MSDQVWLITGASRGMGLSFAREALSRGFKVAATARNPQAVIDALGEQENLLPLRLDVTDADSISSAVAETVATFGGIDVLLNNAGYGIFGSLEETSDAETRQIFETNLFGPMNVTRAVLPTMRAQKSGRIINIASMAAFAADPGGTLYDTTKAALLSLTDVLSKELACFGIQAMCVCPGMIRTEFFGGSSLKTPENLMEEYAGTPARGAMDYCLSHDGRQYGDPEKVAKVLIDVATSEKMPVILPIGKDAVKKFLAVCDQGKAEIEPYIEAASNTSFPRE
ncbi:MAG: SDR family oxidoreductase [Eggerthellales bacterium]|nr:SDR family oxidoreductase [Eggerthellales bacterium]